MAKNEKSVTDLVCEHIKKQKLLPIPVQTLNEEAEATRYFGGDLKEFLAAAKTLGAKSIFVETLYLEDDEFYYDSGIDDEEYLAMNGDFNNECCCGPSGNCKVPRPRWRMLRRALDGSGCGPPRSRNLRGLVRRIRRTR